MTADEAREGQEGITAAGQARGVSEDSHGSRPPLSTTPPEAGGDRDEAALARAGLSYCAPDEKHVQVFCDGPEDYFTIDESDHDTLIAEMVPVLAQAIRNAEAPLRAEVERLVAHLAEAVRQRDAAADQLAAVTRDADQLRTCNEALGERTRDLRTQLAACREAAKEALGDDKNPGLFKLGEETYDRIEGPALERDLARADAIEAKLRAVIGEGEG